MFPQVRACLDRGSTGVSGLPRGYSGARWADRREWPAWTRGKRAGAKQKRGFRWGLLLLAIAITVCVVAWGYLVYAAVDFGGEARDGRDEAWW